MRLDRRNTNIVRDLIQKQIPEAQFSTELDPADMQMILHVRCGLNTKTLWSSHFRFEDVTKVEAYVSTVLAGIKGVENT